MKEKDTRITRPRKGTNKHLLKILRRTSSLRGRNIANRKTQRMGKMASISTPLIECWMKLERRIRESPGKSRRKTSGFKTSSKRRRRIGGSMKASVTT